jgi:hypothetical protein
MRLPWPSTRAGGCWGSVPELQDLLVGAIVVAACVHLAWRFGLIPRKRRGVTSIVRVSDLKRHRPGGRPPA